MKCLERVAREGTVPNGKSPIPFDVPQYVRPVQGPLSLLRIEFRGGHELRAGEVIEIRRPHGHRQ